jgi:hypothetical protein
MDPHFFGSLDLVPDLYLRVKAGSGSIETNKDPQVRKSSCKFVGWEEGWQFIEDDIRVGFF